MILLWLRLTAKHHAAVMAVFVLLAGLTARMQFVMTTNLRMAT